MQQLHLVGFTTDLEGLIFSARKGSKSGSFVVPIDDSLLATIDDARRMRGDEPDGDSRGRAGGGSGSAGGSGGGGSGSSARARPESTLSPREIQARLRAGSTIAEVADAAGVDEDWVHRFAVPILAEQQQVVQRARQLVYTKSRLGDSAQPLGTSVLWNLVDRGLRMTEAAYEAAWRAWNLHGAVWVVQFAYVSRQRSQGAEWEVDLREGTLHARNRLAAELGYIQPGRRRRSQPLFDAPEPEAPAPLAGGARRRAGAKPAKALKSAGAKATSSKTAAPATRATRPSKATASTASKAAPKPSKAAAKTAKATKAGKTGRTAKAVKAAGAGKSARPSGGRKRSSPAPGAGEERVSHLARPMTPPVRRGAARDGTPPEQGRRPTTPAPRPAATRPTASSGSSGSAGTSRRPAPAQSRIERQRGRPAAPPEPAPEAARRPPAAPRPVVPTPTVGEVADGAVVVRRASAAPGSAGAPERTATADARAQAGRPGPESRPPARAADGRSQAGRAPDRRPQERAAESRRQERPAADSRTQNRPASDRPQEPAAGARPSTRPAPEDRPATRPTSEGRPPARPAESPQDRTAAGSGSTRAADGRPAAGGGPQAGRAPDRRPQERAAEPRPPTRSGPAEPAPARRPPARPADAPAPAPAATSPRSQPRPDQGSQPGRANGSKPSDDRVWHGPGSGDPAPPVRIRADMAATASANAAEGRRVRRSAGRDRPLRAR